MGTEFALDVRYELIKPIGHGAYGVVISAVDHVTGQKVAIKKCPSAFEDLVDAKRIVREIRLLMHFNHENIVKVMPDPPLGSLIALMDMRLSSRSSSSSSSSSSTKPIPPHVPGAGFAAPTYCRFR